MDCCPLADNEASHFFVSSGNRSPCPTCWPQRSGCLVFPLGVEQQPMLYRSNAECADMKTNFAFPFVKRFFEDAVTARVYVPVC